MGLLNPERFAQVLGNSLPLEHNQWSRGRGGDWMSAPRGGSVRYDFQRHLPLGHPFFTMPQVDRETALQVYEAVKEHVIENGNIGTKTLRSWTLDPQLYDNLDRSEPWFGWEFEMGFQSQQARAEVMTWTWDTFDNVVYDAEGEGRWESEITFGPQELSKFDDGSADALTFYGYIESVQDKTYRTPGTYVGTHLNVSTPLITAHTQAWHVSYSLARSVAALPIRVNGQFTRDLLFGRRDVYGGFYPMDNGNAHWIECKLFRTTYELAVFKQYVNVAKAITKLANMFATHNYNGAASHNRHDQGEYPYCSNMLQVVTEDAEPVIETGRIPGGLSMADFIYNVDYRNGKCAPDFSPEEGMSFINGDTRYSHEEEDDNDNYGD